MVDQASVQADLARLANEIQAVDIKASTRLQHLEAAIAGSTDTGIWANANLFQLINPDIIVEEYRRKHHAPGRLVRSLELLRNVFIFAPIMFTWLGISVATSAYHSLLAQCLQSCPDQVSQPFLYLWEQSFGGRIPDILRLSSVGLFDFGILSFVFLATLSVSMISARSNRQQELKTQELYADLVHALAGATLYLGQGTASIISPAPGQSLDAVAKNIGNMSNKILGSINDMSTKIAVKFETVADQAGSKFTQVALSFETLTQKLEKQFDRIEQGFTDQIKESNQHIKSLGNLVGGTNQLAIEINAAAGALKMATNDVGDNLKKLVGPVQDFATQQKGLLDAANLSVTHLADAATKLTELDRKQQQWMTQILDTMDALDVFTGRMDSIVTSIGDVNKQQKQFLVDLDKERLEQAKLANLLVEANKGVKEALNELHAGAVNVHSIAVDMNTAIRLQAAMTNPGQMDVAAIVNGYTQAAQVIEKSGRELSDSATMVYNAGLALRNAIADLKAAIK